MKEAIAVLIVGLMLGITSAYTFSNFNDSSDSNTASIDNYGLHGIFCQSIKRAGSNEWSPIDCSRNVITGVTRNHWKILLGQNNTVMKPAFAYVAFGNLSNASTSLNVQGTGLLNESGVSDLGTAPATSACGFGRNDSQVTFVNQPGNGNWSMMIVATNGCSYPVLLNATQLMNDSRTSNTASHQNFTFASANITLVTLQQSDQLNITYIINSTG